MLAVIKPKLTYRIVETDNLGRDYPDESFKCFGIPTKEMAEVICKAINDQYSSSFRWNIVVDSNYKLAPKFEP
jgi:hypothetical protein